MLEWAAVVSDRGKREWVPSVSELVGARVGERKRFAGVRAAGLAGPGWAGSARLAGLTIFFFLSLFLFLIEFLEMVFKPRFKYVWNQNFTGLLYNKSCS